MIPQETLDLIKEKTKILSSEEQGGEASKSQEKEDETISLFEKLLDASINAVFSLPERLLDMLKGKKDAPEKPVKEKVKKEKPVKPKKKIQERVI